MKNQHFSLRSRSLLRSATEVNFVVLACCKSRQFKVINRKGVTLRVSPFLLFLFELFDVVGKCCEVGWSCMTSFFLWKNSERSCCGGFNVEVNTESLCLNK